MEHGAPDVEIVAIAGVEDQERDHIHGETDRRNGEHEAPEHIDGPEEPRDGLDHDPGSDPDQHGTVDEGRENLRAANPG
jgi:hypothetical protein